MSFLGILGIAELLTSYWQVSKDRERGEEAREKFTLQNQIHSDFHSPKRFHLLNFQNFPVAHQTVNSSMD
jgi:hypothetical protein